MYLPPLSGYLSQSTRSVLLFFVVLFIIVGAPGCNRLVPSNDLQVQLKEAVEAKSLPAFAAESKPWRLVQSFYKRRSFRAAWSQPNWLGGQREIRPETNDLLNCLRKASQEGLDPKDYSADQLAAKLEQARHSPAADMVQLDLELTYRFLQYASHLYYGRVNPKKTGALLPASAKEKDLSQVLEQALSEKDVGDALTKLAPALPAYQALRAALPFYWSVARQGGWPAVPTSRSLRIGDRSDAVAILRRNLQQKGDLVAKQSNSDSVFDQDLADAVRNFESRSGLSVDGVADTAMISAANEPVESVIRAIELNLERMRWLPGDLGERYIRVNIPDFRLEVMEQGQRVLEMRVVVGTKENPTPVFSDSMTYLIFNPFWNIPESIALKETLPLLLKNADYARKEGIEIVSKNDEEQVVEPSGHELKEAARDEKAFPYLFRQQPGPKNALGRVKFMFPNQFNVYLHDTPSRHFFDRVERDYSHGCVRVERPLELAEYLLKDNPGWDSQKIHRALESSSEPETVTLARSIPVYLLYWSVWVDSAGRLQQRSDVYNQDALLDQLLEQRSSHKPVSLL